jgi:tRNA(fMet)-specific endonuclease VapC
MEFAEGFPREKEEHCRVFLSRFQVVAPDFDVAWRASRISRYLRRRGSPVGDHEAWIAATALVRDVPLVTRNPRHFQRIPELRLLSY